MLGVKRAMITRALKKMHSLRERIGMSATNGYLFSLKQAIEVQQELQTHNKTTSRRVSAVNLAKSFEARKKASQESQKESDVDSKSAQEESTTQITVFGNEQFGSLRTAGTLDYPLFCANDVCAALGYVNPRDAIAKHVDTPDVAKCDIGVVTGKKAVAQHVDKEDVMKRNTLTTCEALDVNSGSAQEESTTQITVFSNEQFGAVRTAGTFDNPLFCLKDVCLVLDLRSNDVIQRLDKGVVSTHPLKTKGGIQQVLFINEDGLYDVILDSRKPQAKAFRKWVTSEVLPAIRKTGGYRIVNDPLEPRRVKLQEDQSALDRAKFYKSIADGCRGTYKQAMLAYATKELSGKFLIPLPEEEEI